MEIALAAYYFITMSTYSIVAIVFVLVWLTSSKKMQEDFELSLLQTWGQNAEYFIVNWISRPPTIKAILTRYKGWVAYEFTMTSAIFLGLSEVLALAYALIVVMIFNFVYTRLNNAYNRLAESVGLTR